jgi:hypothetical protein
MLTAHTQRWNDTEQNVHVAKIEVREGSFRGGLPYLMLGSGQPLVYLCGFTSNNRNPRPGLERALTLRTLTPLARAGFQVTSPTAGPEWPPIPLSRTWPSVMRRRFATTSVALWMCWGPAPADRWGCN